MNIDTSQLFSSFASLYPLILCFKISLQKGFAASLITNLYFSNQTILFLPKVNGLIIISFTLIILIVITDNCIEVFLYILEYVFSQNQPCLFIGNNIFNIPLVNTNHLVVLSLRNSENGSSANAWSCRHTVNEEKFI